MSRIRYITRRKILQVYEFCMWHVTLKEIARLQDIFFGKTFTVNDVKEVGSKATIMGALSLSLIHISEPTSPH